MNEIPNDIIDLAINALDGSDASDVAVGNQLDLPNGTILTFFFTKSYPTRIISIYYNKNGLAIVLDSSSSIEMVLKCSNSPLVPGLLTEIISCLPRMHHITNRNIYLYDEINEYKQAVSNAVISTEKIELFFIDYIRGEFQKWTVFHDMSMKMEVIDDGLRAHLLL